ncbi:MAG: hypothetical protein ACK5H2_06125, partial [Beutenbergiaceae bacterium]
RCGPVLLAAAVLVLAGCSSTQTLTGTVIEANAGPQYCGAVMESYPPQCGDPVDLVGFSWDGLRFEEESGVRWAQVTMVGTREGDTFTLTEPPSNQ